MQAQAPASGQLGRGHKHLGPSLLLGLEKDLEVVRRQLGFFPQQGQHPQVIFDAMHRIVLG